MKEELADAAVDDGPPGGGTARAGFVVSSRPSGPVLVSEAPSSSRPSGAREPGLGGDSRLIDDGPMSNHEAIMSGTMNKLEVQASAETCSLVALLLQCDLQDP